MSLKQLAMMTGLTGLLAAGLGCDATAARSDSASASRQISAAPCITPEEADRMADEVLQLVNLERATIGVPPVETNATLEKIAGRYACRMVSDAFFGHQDPRTGHGPGERAVAGRYSFYSVGENLAAGQESAAEAVKVWMESPAHRRIILDPKWTQVGIAVRTGGEYGIYWVQEFGDPAE